jgi:hypothetical protein
VAQTAFRAVGFLAGSADRRHGGDERHDSREQRAESEHRVLHRRRERIMPNAELEVGI